MHARTSSPETHLELDDRLADHREQPRRQREQLRRELVVRHTGSDRRRRLPVPREQHRHELLQPLQQPIRSFSHIHALQPAGERGKARCANSNAFLAACCRVCTAVAVYPESVHRVPYITVQFHVYPGEYP
jgi:hypothetical protein